MISLTFHGQDLLAEVRCSPEPAPCGFQGEAPSGALLPGSSIVPPTGDRGYRQVRRGVRRERALRCLLVRPGARPVPVRLRSEPRRLLRLRRGCAGGLLGVQELPKLVGGRPTPCAGSGDQTSTPNKRPATIGMHIIQGKKGKGITISRLPWDNAARPVG